MIRKSMFIGFIIANMGSSAFAQQSTAEETKIEVAKESAKSNLETAKSAAEEMAVASTSAPTVPLQHRYEALSEMIKGAILSVKAAVATTKNISDLKAVEAKAKEVNQAIENAVTEIKAKNIEEASAKAVKISEAVTEMAKAAHEGEATAKAVRQAVTDIKALGH